MRRVFTPEWRAWAMFRALAGLILPLGAAAQDIRLGSEFQVNSYTTRHQVLPGGVAADADGDFVVVWNGYDEQGFLGFGVFGRRFSSSGGRLASEFQVNSYTLSLQVLPSVAVDADGDFVVAWESYRQDGSGYGVFAQRFSSAGSALASEFQVNTYTINDQGWPVVATDADGDFVVAWESLGQDGAFGVFARQFSSAGGGLASEFRVNSFTVSSQARPAIADDDDGDFVVVWRSLIPTPFPFYDIFARRFSSAGTPLGSEFQVNSYSKSTFYLVYPVPAVAADADGDFIVAWQGVTADYCCVGVLARRFSSAGASLAIELLAFSPNVGMPVRLALAADADGGFVVAWEGFDGSDKGISARRFSSAGELLAVEPQVNSYTIDRQSIPAVAAEADGDFVVAWNSHSQDGSDGGVFAQRFAVPTPTATATATVTPTATPTPTTTNTPTLTPVALYEVPTLSNGAMLALALFLLTVCLAFLRRRSTGLR